MGPTMFISDFDIMSDVSDWVGRGLAEAFGRLQGRFRWEPFALAEAAEALGLPAPRTALAVSRLARAGWLERIGRGSYVALDARWALATLERRPLARYFPHPFHPVLSVAVAGSLQVFGGRLRSLALFGSCARLAYASESDVDLLIVTDGLGDAWEDRRAEIEPVARTARRVGMATASQGGGLHLPQFVLWTPSEVAAEPPLLLDLTEDASVLFDPDRTLASTLQSLREKLRRHGARRITPADGLPYWDLHPGARLEEVGEL